jgi:hypothetical protein
MKTISIQSQKFGPIEIGITKDGVRTFNGITAFSFSNEFIIEVTRLLEWQMEKDLKIKILSNELEIMKVHKKVADVTIMENFIVFWFKDCVNDIILKDLQLEFQATVVPVYLKEENKHYKQFIYTF